MKIQSIYLRPYPRIKFKHKELETFLTMLVISTKSLSSIDITNPQMDDILNTASQIITIDKVINRISARLLQPKKDYIFKFSHIEAIALIFFMRNMQAYGTSYAGFVVNFAKTELHKFYNL